MSSSTFTQAQAAGLLSARAASQPEASPYDFRHPERSRSGRGLWQGLTALHEGLATRLSAALSELLHSEVETTLAGFEQSSYGEFLARLDRPTCLNVLQAEPAAEGFALDLSPPILGPILDRLLGGGGDVGFAARRPLTAIELRIVSRVVRLFLDEMQRAWQGVVEMTLDVARVESHPLRLPALSNGLVVIHRFEVRLGQARGPIRLCLPHSVARQICQRLAPAHAEPSGSTPETARQIGQALRGSVVSLSVRLAGTQITTSDLFGLRVGDIITTRKDVQSPLLVFVENVPKFRARPGAYKGHKAIRIQDLIADPAAPLAE